MKKKTTKEHIIDVHTNTATMALAALITVFHLQMEVAHNKHNEHEQQLQATVPHTAAHPDTTKNGSDLFEREREIHPTHGSYGARARYVTATGS